MPLAVCSALSIVLLLWPTAQGYQIPLSMEWAMGQTAGYFRLATMGLTLSVLGVKLWVKGCRFDALTCLFPMACLGYLASSNPWSMDHLAVFAFLALGLVIWHWLLAARLDDGKLKFMALAVLAAASVCLFSLGTGERALGVCTIVTANFAFYDHVL